MRIRILSAIVLACFAAGAQSQPAARIKIDTGRVIGEVDPHLFGNFTEHLGRCIYGGIFEEGSPLSDSDGFRKDVMEAARGLGVTLLRWPGGNFASGYNWVDGIGPRDQRPARRDDAWGALESNRFGTDEFLQVLPAARRRALPLHQCRARHGRPGPPLGGVLQRAGQHLLGRPAAQKRPREALESEVSGASATRSTARGSWATRMPRITPSSPSKRPKPCGAPTIPSS